MTWVACAFAVAAGMFVGWGDLHTDDTGVIVFLLLAASFIAGTLQPRHAWRWGLLVALWIPAAELWHAHAGAPRESAQSLSSVAPIAAFTAAVGCAGAYAGAGVRAALRVHRA